MVAFKDFVYVQALLLDPVHSLTIVPKEKTLKRIGLNMMELQT